MNKSILSRKEKKMLSNTALRAFYNQSYRDAIKRFEKYHEKYDLGEDLLYQFGMLYDHMGQEFMEMSRRAKSPATKRRYREKSSRYFEKAIGVYNLMLKKNPKSFNAVYGIGKVYRNKGNYEKALLYSKKAYRMSKGKAVYGIGLIYSMMGDDKKAEYWYKKDLRDKGEDDPGAVLNYVVFSNRKYREKMRKYGEVLKKYYDKQPEYFRNSAWGKLLKKDIDMILYNPSRPNK